MRAILFDCSLRVYKNTVLLIHICEITGHWLQEYSHLVSLSNLQGAQCKCKHEAHCSQSIKNFITVNSTVLHQAWGFLSATLGVIVEIPHLKKIKHDHLPHRVAIISGFKGRAPAPATVSASLQGGGEAERECVPAALCDMAETGPIVSAHMPLVKLSRMATQSCKGTLETNPPV